MMPSRSFFSFKKCILSSLVTALIATSLWAAPSEEERSSTDEEFYLEIRASRSRPLAARPRQSSKEYQHSLLFEAFPLTIKTFSSPASIESFLDHCNRLIHSAMEREDDRDIHLFVNKMIQNALALLKRESLIRHSFQEESISLPIGMVLPEWKEPEEPPQAQSFHSDLSLSKHLWPSPNGSASANSLCALNPQGPSSFKSEESLLAHSIQKPLLSTQDDTGSFLGAASLENLTAGSDHPLSEDLSEAEDEDDPQTEVREAISQRGSREERESEEETSFSDDLEESPFKMDLAELWAKEKVDFWESWLSLRRHPDTQSPGSSSSLLSHLSRESAGTISHEVFRDLHTTIQEDVKRTFLDLVKELSQGDISIHDLFLEGTEE